MVPEAPWLQADLHANGLAAPHLSALGAPLAPLAASGARAAVSWPDEASDELWAPLAALAAPLAAPAASGARLLQEVDAPALQPLISNRGLSQIVAPDATIAWPGGPPGGL